MKRALVVAYFFPPIGGGGVQRTVKFARYLPDFGYEPVIVTGYGGSITDKLGSDETLAHELSHDLVVHRIAAPEPPPPTLTRARLERWLRIEPAWRRWWVGGAIAAGATAENVDVIFATMSPFDSAEVGASLSKQLGKPWVADLRDPWALDEMLVWPTAVQRLAETRRMRRALRRADAIVMNTAEAAAELGRRFPELASRTTVITNGFDAADFESPVTARSDPAFRIVHAGFLHTAAGRPSRMKNLHHALGGANAEVDYLTRSHVYLLEAAERILSRRPELEPVLEVHLVGPQTEADRAVSARFVHSHGYLPHEESVTLVRTADLLFLPMHNLPEGRRATIVPGKTYEYVATGRPILAAVPDGDARELLTRAGTAIVTRPDDVEAMAEGILAALEARERGAAPPVDADLLAAYERRELTRRLAGVFDGLTAR
jgi:glycosyltransferase involved in cell wall biosynthesis